MAADVAWRGEGVPRGARRRDGVGWAPDAVKPRRAKRVGISVAKGSVAGQRWRRERRGKQTDCLLGVIATPQARDRGRPDTRARTNALILTLPS